MTQSIEQTMGWQFRAADIHLARAKLRAKRAFDSLRSLLPSRRRKAAAVLRDRLDVCDRLAALPRSQSVVSGPVLVDATWDNPNYWYRYAVLRCATGARDEVGLIGPHNRDVARATLNALGISKVEDFQARMSDHRSLEDYAAALLGGVKHPADILAWELPSGLPASIVYDGILKRQRSAQVDLRDPLILDYVTEALVSIRAAEALLDAVRPGLVVLSHAIEFRYGSIAWCALQRGVPVVVAFGNYGSLRFCRLKSVADFFETVDRPYPQDLAKLDATPRRFLADTGRAYLQSRMSGQTTDLGARFAFVNAKSSITRDEMCRMFAWDPAKPIVAVYASNWFDYPHGVGMSHFCDFEDWLRVTLAAAKNQEGVNWLFRAHPCDQWYGGITLADLMSEAIASHVRLSPFGWNGSDVQRSVDGLVTVHGTAGVEFAAAGKPVLLGDRGWYHDVGFADASYSRADYVAALADMGWLQRPRFDEAELAMIFAGVYFYSHPDRTIQIGDDSEQDHLHSKLAGMLDQHSGAIATEIEAVSSWWMDGAPHYHTWHVLRRATNTH